MTETELNNDLDIEDDDIITGTQAPIPQHALFSAPQGQSQPVAKVFIERGRRFTLSLTVQKLRREDMYCIKPNQSLTGHFVGQLL